MHGTLVQNANPSPTSTRHVNYWCSRRAGVRSVSTTSLPTLTIIIIIRRIEQLGYLRAHVQGQAPLVDEDEDDYALEDGAEEGVDAKHQSAQLFGERRGNLEPEPRSRDRQTHTHKRFHLSTLTTNLTWTPFHVKLLCTTDLYFIHNVASMVLYSRVLIQSLFSLYWYRINRLYLRGDGHQELVKTPKEDVGTVTDPDVIRRAHEQQQAGLQGCDGKDDQLGPAVPADLHKACSEGGDRTCGGGQGEQILISGSSPDTDRCRQLQFYWLVTCWLFSDALPLRLWAC